jgi:hypothetical protein
MARPLVAPLANDLATDEQWSYTARLVKHPKHSFDNLMTTALHPEA